VKKEIEEFKNRNGGVISFTTKEMLGALDVKIDKILGRLEKGEIRFTKIDTSLTWHKRLIWLVYMSLAGIVYLVLELTGVL